MTDLEYTIDIYAPKEKVWHTMLEPESYKEWTKVFHPGSYYEGSWDKGSKIRFIAEENGKISGMFSQIVENIPYEYVSIEHLGEIIDGIEDGNTEEALKWKGAHENYRFTEHNGLTTLDIELTGLGGAEDVTKMFDDMWPRALKELKDICER